MTAIFMGRPPLGVLDGTLAATRKRSAPSMENLMIGVLTHHWAKADRVEEAKKLLDGNGLAQSLAPGFVSRHTLYSTGDPAKITTLVVWTSDAIYEQWRASPERAIAMRGAEALWSRAPESERFLVA
jgi:heme-degrading monooxygenase HmoA